MPVQTARRVIRRWPVVSLLIVIATAFAILTMSVRVQACQSTNQVRREIVETVDEVIPDAAAARVVVHDKFHQRDCWPGPFG